MEAGRGLDLHDSVQFNWASDHNGAGGGGIAEGRGEKEVVGERRGKDEVMATRGRAEGTVGLPGEAGLEGHRRITESSESGREQLLTETVEGQKAA